MASKKIKIPFSTRDGNMLSYTGCLPGDTYDEKYNNGRWIWLDNYVFYDDLKFDGFHRGCSSAGATFKSLNDGKEYNVFLKDLADIINLSDLRCGIVHGQFTFIKRGSNYGLRYVKENENGKR